MAQRRRSDEIDVDHPALSENRPWFVDNRGGNTLAKAIKNHIRALRGESAILWELSIASAFFTVPGFRLLADEIAHVNEVRLLLGAEPLPESLTLARSPGDSPEPEFTRRRVAKSLEDQESGLEVARNLLPFDDESDRSVRRLLEMIHTGKIKVRRYERNFLHAKAYIFRVNNGGLLVGSSNMTRKGLSQNVELNLGHYQDPVVEKVESWFDELWEASEDFDLAGLYDRMMADYSPYMIFLVVLWHLYGDELREEEIADDRIPVTSFQQHGIWRALRIMEQYGGAIVADGVGLGKSFIAGEIIRQYRARRQKVLLICPAALRDETWNQFQTRFDLQFECISYEQLARDRQLGGDGGHIRHELDDYQLIVIDEAHAYRNPSSPARAGVLRQLLRGQRRNLLLLTATPVNNSLWDLYHLISYFVRQDAAFSEHGILSIRDHFNEANREEPENLNPDMLFPIIDATTVKRTRQFIRRFYENDLIRTPDGRHVPIQFPTPLVSTINYDLEQYLPGLLDQVEEAMMPEDGHPRVTFARYKVDQYELNDDDEERDDTILVGLIRSGILKRFESSVYAFARTTRRMANDHREFLETLDRGFVARRDALDELSTASDDDEINDLLSNHPDAQPAAHYDVNDLRRDVEADLEILVQLAERAESGDVLDSSKLNSLADQLAAIAAEAERTGIDEEGRRDKRKVLVFSFFADTVDWIVDYLNHVLNNDARLAAYRDRLASVAGNDARDGVSREHAVYGFAPKSIGLKPGQTLEEADQFDILVTTDVLAEGVNLQQAQNIINFDLPWNPMRLVQRHGRIDRIGTDHDSVYLRTFFPDQNLNRLLRLEARVRRKLAQAAASVGVESTPIEGGAESQLSFSDNQDEINDLYQEDNSLFVRGGTRSAVQSGEEYRHELRIQLQNQGDEIRNLPWKAGSGLARGTRRGHFFCAKVGERTYLRFVPIEGGQADVVWQTATCLRIIECTEGTERVVPTDLKQLAYAAWEQARQHIYDAWSFETDPANLQPRVSRINREIADFVRDNPPPEMEQRRIERILDAVESPCTRREENQLRRTFNESYSSNADRSVAIVNEIEALGLEPFQAPAALPPITHDDIHLVVWMAVESVESSEMNSST